MSCIQAFLAVVQTGSFVAAAGQAGGTKSGLSRAVSTLEANLGVKLLTRTTRRIALTQEGQLYFERCGQLLQDLEETEDQITKGKAEPRGKLRVHLPGAFGREVVIPALNSFLRQYPHIDLFLGLSDHVIDLIRDGFDLAVCIGEMHDTSLVARRIYQTRSVTVASPDYLKTAPRIRTPRDLERGHRCINFALPQNGEIWPWHFARDGDAVTFQPNAVLTVNDASTAVEAAVAGLGITYIGDFLVQRYLQQGRVVRILTEWETAGPPIHVLYLPNRYLSQRARLFIDYLAMLGRLSTV